MSSVHSRPPWGPSASFGCVRSIPVRPGGRRVHSGAFGQFPSPLWIVCVRSVPVLPGDPRVLSCAIP